VKSFSPHGKIRRNVNKKFETIMDVVAAASRNSQQMIKETSIIYETPLNGVKKLRTRIQSIVYSPFFPFQIFNFSQSESINFLLSQSSAVAETMSQQDEE
jgi:hypothetical protein